MAQSLLSKLKQKSFTFLYFYLKNTMSTTNLDSNLVVIDDKLVYKIRCDSFDLNNKT